MLKHSNDDDEFGVDFVMLLWKSCTFFVKSRRWFGAVSLIVWRSGFLICDDGFHREAFVFILSGKDYSFFISSLFRHCFETNTVVNEQADSTLNEMSVGLDCRFGALQWWQK